MEEGGEGFLQAIDRMLHARRGIVLFNDENSAGLEPLTDSIEQRIPVGDWQFVEHIDDRHGVECPSNAVVVADDALNSVQPTNFADVGIDGDRTRAPLASEHGENAVTRADIEKLCALRNAFDDTQKRAGEKTNEDVRARSQRELPISSMQYS